MLWSWISSFPSNNSLFGECEAFDFCSTSAVLGLRPSSTESQKPQLWSLPFCGSTIVVLWAFSMGPGAGRSVREILQWSKAEARLAVSCSCSGLGVLSWLGCIPWTSVSVLWTSLKWRAQLWLKVTLVSSLELQVLFSGSRRTSPGEDFFFFLPPILVRPGSGPLVISFTLYWLLLHGSKWLRGKG